MNNLTTNHIQQIKNDCLYSNVFERYRETDQLEHALRRSGNLEEFRSVMDEKAMLDMRFMTMPIRMAGDASDGAPQAIIVSTGSYSPVHKGHLDILEVARKYVTGLGYRVIQGVLSASHDAYVSIKNGGAAKLHVGQRSQNIYEAIQSSDWLSLDRFEGEGVSCAINFSTVLERVRNYVLAHNKAARVDLKVFYVFGSDNVGFAEAFVGNNTYHGICVDRGGYDISTEREMYRGEQTVHFLDGNQDTAWISSTKVRAAEKASVPQVIDSEDVYLVRTDCVPDAFAQSLGSVISRFTASGVMLRYISSADFILASKGTISLDKFVRGEYNLDTSRVFEVSSGQLAAQSMTSLVGDLEAQMAGIPPGHYTLVDDDSVSGFTMNAIEKMISQGDVTISGRATLISQVLGVNERLYDVIDARDFLIGSEKCGLVVDLFGEHIRVPYLFPFVNLVARARILPDVQLACSREIWILNKQYAGARTIDSLEESQRKLYAYLGFTGTVGEVCDHFIALINNYLGSYS